MKPSDIKNRAKYLFNSGFSCSESILKALLEQYREKESQEMVRFASGLCGGIGGSREEACGAITGAVLAIGALFGRNEAGIDNERAKWLSAELLQEFNRQFGTCRCIDLVAGLEKQVQLEKCADMTGKTAEIAMNLIDGIR